MATNRFSLGLTIVVIGIFLFLGKIGFIGFLGKLLWPILIMALGVLLHYLYAIRVVPSIALVPAGMITTYSLMFLFCTIFGWGAMGYLWPGFIFGIAVGLYEYYMFDRSHPQAAFIGAVVLAVAAGVFFGMTVLFTIGLYFISLVLIAAGLYMLFRRKQGRRYRERQRRAR